MKVPAVPCCALACHLFISKCQSVCNFRVGIIEKSAHVALLCAGEAHFVFNSFEILIHLNANLTDLSAQGICLRITKADFRQRNNLFLVLRFYVISWTIKKKNKLNEFISDQLFEISVHDSGRLDSDVIACVPILKKNPVFFLNR